MDKKTTFLSVFILFIAVSLLFSFSGIYFSLPDDELGASGEEKNNTVIIIDAGHGGEDGGASTYGDVPEKELNLEISKTLSDLLTLCGAKVVMTRSEDILLYDKSSDYDGKKKSQDLAKRLEIANSYDDAILISIHMNAFPEEKYKGLQVYYSPNTESSCILASLIQNETRIKLMPNNNRKPKTAGSNIYLLYRYMGTGVLIECGFLSNPDEYSRLCTKEYRCELSMTIASSILKYIANGGR